MKVRKFELIKTLSDGMSIQSKVTNKVWVLIALISFYSSVAHINAQGQVALLFDLQPVSPNNFYSYSFIAICLLCIAYTSAHSQVILIRRQIEKIGEMGQEIHHVQLSRIVDSIVNPTWHRVGPLTMPGNYQNKLGKAVDNKVFRSSVYWLLKIVTLLVFYAWPYYSLCSNFIKVDYCKSFIPASLTQVIFWLLLVSAFLALFRALLLDISSIYSSANTIYKM